MYEVPPIPSPSRWRRAPGEPWLSRAERIVWAAVSLSGWLVCCWLAISYNDSCHGPGASYLGGCQGGGEWRVWAAQLASLGFFLCLMRFLPIGRFARGTLLGLYAVICLWLPFALALLFIL